ncbi:hypothetical protein KCP77_22770 [Salmonella enterica subsp. enterica]|nr:hypothetical protein KCP77_22770 [Salmonella enterica subsp. enterica]
MCKIFHFVSGTVDSPVRQKSTTGLSKTAIWEMLTVATKGTTGSVPYTLAIFPLKTSLGQFRILQRWPLLMILF